MFLLLELVDLIIQPLHSYFQNRKWKKLHPLDQRLDDVLVEFNKMASIQSITEQEIKQQVRTELETLLNVY